MKFQRAPEIGKIDLGRNWVRRCNRRVPARSVVGHQATLKGDQKTKAKDNILVRASAIVEAAWARGSAPVAVLA